MEWNGMEWNAKNIFKFLLYELKAKLCFALKGKNEFTTH